MTKHSPHKRWKGHCLMCADNKGAVKGSSGRWSTPFRELRKLGVKRRYSRNKPYGED